MEGENIMSELKSLIIVMAVLSSGLVIFGGFYSDMATNTGHTSRSLNQLQNVTQTRVDAITKQSIEILNQTEQPTEINFWTFGNVLLGTGISIFKLVITIPATYYTVSYLIGQAFADVGVPIPAEILALIGIIIMITITFSLAKVISGRSD